MRMRMYGSRLRKRCRTSTCPSAGSASSTSTRRKLSARASPSGRDASWIWRFVIVMGGLFGAASVGRVGSLDALAARGQPLQELERAGRVREQQALGVEQRRLAERV